ncbi:MAG TPA: L-aspartate oxidase [Terriglobia bacterium]|nr:L-aspartate oxidase [Terriglobia bacterium]
MSMTTGQDQKTDFVVVGSGIAAMRAAVDLARHGEVLILNKGDLFKPAAHYHLGGIAVALAEDDEVPLHLHDTLQAGDGLCRESAVRVLVEEGPNLIQELIEWGMCFHRNGTKLAFTSVGSHSRSRVLHAHGDSTGGEMRRVLMEKAKSLPAIHLQAHAFVVDLIQDGGRVAGVCYLDEKSSTLKTVHARAVLLATGGLCQAFHETTNPPFACGDGVAMAFRAGALLSDMEFVQFHPTVLYVKGAPRYVLSEALRGEGAQLRNIDLERFMPRFHEAAELAPRDVVSRAMVMEMAKSKSDFTYLDLTGLPAERIKKRFPQIYSRCLDSNIDITADLIPVRPAAHYAMGGISTDLDGVTSLPGLYAAGEVAATGVHGANRLASNSLLEDLVYGARAAAAMCAQHPKLHKIGHAEKKSKDREAPPPSAIPNHPSQNHFNPDQLGKLTAESRALLSEKVGIIREGKGLAKAVSRLNDIYSRTPGVSSRHHVEARNLLEVARLIAHSALGREESRGAHYRSDFPLKNSATPPEHSFISKNSPVFFE